MIINRVFGGLGNQLFSYAAARRLALANKSELVLDHISGFRYDNQYHRHYQLDHFSISCRKATAAERLMPFSRIRRFLLRRLNATRPFERRCYIRQEGIDFDSRLLSYQLKGTLYLEGYWQSESYFRDVEPQIREDLRILPPKDNINQQMAARIQSQVSVAVHVRFFDEPEQSSPIRSSTNNASEHYYNRAIAEMERNVCGAHYFLFSDRPEDARTMIALSSDRITLVDHNQGDAMAYADLWLMTQCQHFIIANSTFSWWGAWLSDNPNKVVIAPGFEKRAGASSWGFRGLLPTEWIKL